MSEENEGFLTYGEQQQLIKVGMPLWDAGYKEGFLRGKTKGVEEGRSTLSVSWFFFVLFMFSAVSMTIGTVMGSTLSKFIFIQQEGGE